MRRSFFSIIGILLIYPTLISGVQATDIVAKVIHRMKTVSSFAATLQIQHGTDPGPMIKMRYRRPGKLRLEYPDGKILATNGIKLWLHSPIGNITGEQDVAKPIGGIYRLIGGLNGIASATSDGYTVKLKRQSPFKHIVMSVDKSGFLRKLQKFNENGDLTLGIRLTNVQIDAGFATSTFSYHPGSNSKTILNPFNFQK